jgi:hypothetical protein
VIFSQIFSIILNNIGLNIYIVRYKSGIKIHGVARVRRRGENIQPQNILSSIYLANMGRQGILVFYY